MKAGAGLALKDAHYNTLFHRTVVSKPYTVVLYIMTNTTSYKAPVRKRLWGIRGYPPLTTIVHRHLDFRKRLRSNTTIIYAESQRPFIRRSPFY